MAAGAVLAVDEASLLLRRNAGGQTAWAFEERPYGAPPLAHMSPRLARALGQRSRLPSASASFLTDAAVGAMADELSANAFCVVDGLIGRVDLAHLRAEVVALRTAGTLARSQLAGGATGSHAHAYTDSAARGDEMGWFSGSEARLWPRRTLSCYLRRLDELVARLAPLVPELGSVVDRSRAMVACFPGGGARYGRHCDNSCSAGEGERCNGRRLTAILYLNDEWEPHHGGELRLYAPFAPERAEATLAELRAWVAEHRDDPDKEYVARVLPTMRARLRATSLEDGPAVCDVPPLADRLVLFLSDYSVPHEVLPSHAERYAITLWFFDADERERALSKAGAEERGAWDAAEAIHGIRTRAEA